MAEYYVFNLRDARAGWMDKCIVWWREGGHGYTYDLNLAGIFTEADMEKRYPDPATCCYVPRETVDKLSYSPKLLWEGAPPSYKGHSIDWRDFIRCWHERLNEDGICRACGRDCRAGSQ